MIPRPTGSVADSTEWLASGDVVVAPLARIAVPLESSVLTYPHTAVIVPSHCCMLSITWHSRTRTCTPTRQHTDSPARPMIHTHTHTPTRTHRRTQTHTQTHTRHHTHHHNWAWQLLAAITHSCQGHFRRTFAKSSLGLAAI